MAKRYWVLIGDLHVKRERLIPSGDFPCSQVVGLYAYTRRCEQLRKMCEVVLASSLNRDIKEHAKMIVKELEAEPT
jgi:hypothetical protein